jgi:hypothetical protein
MEDNTVRPYETLPPKPAASGVLSKYDSIRPIPGSHYRLARSEIVSIEEVMALPEAAPIAGQAEAEAQAAIAAEEEEEEAVTLGNP